MPCGSVNPLGQNSGKVCGSTMFLSLNAGSMSASESRGLIPAAFMLIAEVISMLAVRYINPTITLGAAMPYSYSIVCRDKPPSIIEIRSQFIYAGIKLMVSLAIYPMNKKKISVLKIFRRGGAFAKYFYAMIIGADHYHLAQISQPAMSVTTKEFKRKENAGASYED